MYIYLLTYCELKLLHDHSNILHNAHYACLYVDNFNFTSCRVEFKLAILVYNYTRLYTVSHRAVPLQRLSVGG